MVLDVRSKEAFAAEHMFRSSTFIGLDGNFAPWVGAMIVDVKQPILLVSDQTTKWKRPSPGCPGWGLTRCWATSQVALNGVEEGRPGG